MTVPKKIENSVPQKLLMAQSSVFRAEVPMIPISNYLVIWSKCNSIYATLGNDFGSMPKKGPFYKPSSLALKSPLELAHCRKIGPNGLIWAFDPEKIRRFL